MEFTIERQDFQSTLAKVVGCIGKPNSMLSILEHGEIKAQDGRIVISATDLEIAVRAQCDADIIEPGNALVPAKKLMEILKTIDTEVSIAHADGKTTIRAGSAKWVLPSMDVEEYPLMTFLETGGSKLVSRAFRDMITKTAYAVGDGMRPSLSGGALVVQNNNICLVGIDGHRGSKFSQRVEFPDTELVVIPLKGLKMLATLCGSADIVCLSVRNNILMARTELDDMAVSVRLLEEQYPDYGRMFPSSILNNDIVIDREKFLAMAKRVAIVDPQIYFSMDKTELELSSFCEVGEARESLGVENHGKPVDFAVSAPYLVDALTSFDSENVLFFPCEEKGSPIVLKPAADIDLVAVVMPLSISTPLRK